MPSSKSHPPPLSPRWHVDSVGHVADWHLVHWPTRKQRRKKLATHLSMQTAHAIDRPASAHSQIRHVERLGSVIAVAASQSQQIVEGNAECLRGIFAEVLSDQGRRKTVKSGRHRRVGREEIARPGDGEGDLE